MKSDNDRNYRPCETKIELARVRRMDRDDGSPNHHHQQHPALPPPTCKVFSSSSVVPLSLRTPSDIRRRRRRRLFMSARSVAFLILIRAASRRVARAESVSSWTRVAALRGRKGTREIVPKNLHPHVMHRRLLRLPLIRRLTKLVLILSNHSLHNSFIMMIYFVKFLDGVFRPETD